MKYVMISETMKYIDSGLDLETKRESHARAKCFGSYREALESHLDQCKHCRRHQEFCGVGECLAAGAAHEITKS